MYCSTIRNERDPNGTQVKSEIPMVIEAQGLFSLHHAPPPQKKAKLLTPHV